MKPSLFPISLTIFTGLAVFPAGAAGIVVYDNLPNPIPPSSPSLPFQAGHTSEFGDLVSLASGATDLADATVLMTDWALFSNWSSQGYSNPAGFNEAITITLYNIDSSSGTAEPGSAIDSVTQNFLIPWQPEPSASCRDGQAWLAPDNQCYDGFNFTVDFSLGDVPVPGSFIYGISYDTTTFGPNPIGGTGGPYDSLNVAVNTTAPPQVGTRPLPDTAYVDGDASAYNTAGPTGVFRQDSGWTPYSAAVEFATPEPASYGLLFVGLLAIGSLARRRKRA